MGHAIIIDTETTGFSEPVEPIEVAWLWINGPKDLNVLDLFEARYQPAKPIDLGALSTHHIMDEDLVGLPPFTGLLIPEGVEYLIGHNVDYDWKVLGSPDIKRICTVALCRFLFPKADSHSQGAMMYLLDRASAKSRLVSAHSAGTDVINLKHLLSFIIPMIPNIETWEDLWIASESTRIPTVITFGKHKGKAIADIPLDYKRWLLGQPDLDPYLEIALRK